MLMDLKAAFVRICDLFNSDDHQRNWLIYVEEEKNRIIIERVAGEKAKLGFFNDQEVKDEPIFDQAQDPQPLNFDESIWPSDYDDRGGEKRSKDSSSHRDQPSIETLDSGGESLGADTEDFDSVVPVVPVVVSIDSATKSSRPKTRSATNKDAKFDLLDGSYVCRICGKTLASPKLARRHVDAKHGRNGEKNKDERTKNGDDDHDDTRESSSTVVCSVCDKTFKNETALKRHRRKSHARDADKEWTVNAETPAGGGVETKPTAATTTTTTSTTTMTTTTKTTTDEEDVDFEEDGDDEDEEEEDDLEKILDENLGTLVPLENSGKKGGEKQACKYCDKNLSCPRALKRHVATRHMGERRSFTCPVCEKIYKCQSKMREHLLKEHPDSDQANKRYPCPICAEEFLTSLKMKEHLNREHTTATKTCSICDKNFKQVYSLEYHMDIVHSELPNPFADGESHLCDNCGASFSTKGSLNLHRYTRHVEADKHDERKMRRRKQTAEKKKQGLGKSTKPKEKREFVCRICGKVFTSHNCMLKQHIAIVHEGKRYPCEICGAEFTTPDKKRVHIGNIHKGIKHKCEYCGRDFTLKDTLKTHINAVHKKIKHRCDICAQEFSIIQDMRQHIKAVHHGIKSKCEFCGKDFNRPQEMKRHQRKVHQDNLIMGVAPKIEMVSVAPKIEMLNVGAKIEMVSVGSKIEIQPQPIQQQQQRQLQPHQQQTHQQQIIPPSHVQQQQQPPQQHGHLQPQFITAEQVAQLAQHVILTTTADGQTITQTITSL